MTDSHDFPDRPQTPSTPDAPYAPGARYEPTGPDSPSAEWASRRRRSSRRKRSGRTTALIAAGLLAVAVAAGGIGFVLGTGAGDDPGQSAQAVAPSASETGAAETRDPRASASEEIPPEGIVATRVRIPRLGIDLEIVEGDGVDAPMNLAAHFPGTAWPGGADNNVYIYGHAQEGMFLSLWEAEIGDEVILELEDGTERRYVVTEVLPEVPWDAIEYLDPTPTEQLTLQTSTSYTPTSPKFVVIAVPTE